jgi:hypothetical protein
MVIGKATADSGAGRLPSTELPAAMRECNQMPTNSGVLLSGAGRKGPAGGK